MLCENLLFQVLGIEKERGTLQPGAIADLVLLDNDLNVQVHTTPTGAVPRCSFCWYAHTVPCVGAWAACRQRTWLAISPSRGLVLPLPPPLAPRLPRHQWTHHRREAPLLPLCDVVGLVFKTACSSMF